MRVSNVFVVSLSVYVSVRAITFEAVDVELIFGMLVNLDHIWVKLEPLGRGHDHTVGNADFVT